jgi:hypothetical protein
LINSKSKGNTFERKIANLFSERFKLVTGKDQSFRRNIDSGSFFGGTNNKRTLTHDLDKAIFGDIISPNNFKYSIECKHYATTPSLAAIFKQSCKEWDKWIAQAFQDGDAANRIPIIIVKYNKIEELIILSDLPDNLSFIVRYKKCYVATLSAFLELENSSFFTT